MRPLEGITVISLEQAIAAPICTRQLADLGARVIKIERPGVGDFARSYDTRVHGLSAFFVWANRSKESVTLDVKHGEGNVLLHQLVGRADILVQNLAPGAAQRLGLSFEQLQDDHPELIVCDISGYGSDGPYRDKKAYDLLIQAESGVLSTTGTEDESAKAGCSFADLAAGMYAYSNILTALLQRHRTGRGCRIDVSMLEAATEWMSGQLYYAYDGAEPPARTGAAHASIYPYGPFTAGDGNTVILGLQNEREWRAFCVEVLKRPELAADERFASNTARSVARHELEGIIKQVFSGLSVTQVRERLDGANIANARMNTMHDLWAHPQLKARNRWREVNSAAGPVAALLPPGIPDSYEPVMGSIPALGEHTEGVLRELEYDAARIARLREQKVI